MAVNLAEVDGYLSLAEQRLIAAISLMFMWLKVFDWLRLFEKTSFYIKLIVETFRDITYFLIVLMAAFITIGCSMYMLEMNKD